LKLKIRFPTLFTICLTESSFSTGVTQYQMQISTNKISIDLKSKNRVTPRDPLVFERTLKNGPKIFERLHSQELEVDRNASNAYKKMRTSQSQQAF
jgi:hypothetical protein